VYKGWVAVLIRCAGFNTYAILIENRGYPKLQGTEFFFEVDPGLHSELGGLVVCKK